jgi:hypothetical protein
LKDNVVFERIEQIKIEKKIKEENEKIAEAGRVTQIVGDDPRFLVKYFKLDNLALDP